MPTDKNRPRERAFWAGLTTIVDGAGFGLRHFRHLTVNDIRCGTRFLQVRERP